MHVNVTNDYHQLCSCVFFFSLHRYRIIDRHIFLVCFKHEKFALYLKKNANKQQLNQSKLE